MLALPSLLPASSGRKLHLLSHFDFCWLIVKNLPTEEGTSSVQRREYDGAVTVRWVKNRG